MHFLYRTKILPIKEKHLESWWNLKEVELLILATEVGSNKNRLKALDKLRTLPSYGAKIKAHLIRMLYSNNLFIADKSLEILNKNYMSRELENDESYQEALRYLSDFRQYKNDLVDYYSESSEGLKPKRRNKDDMQRLNDLKKLLKRGFR